MQLKVGQEVYRVSSSRYFDERCVSITKIGRKWIGLSSGGRFDPVTMLEDGNGYMSPATIYLSKEQYYQEKYKKACLDTLRKVVMYIPDGKFTTSQVQSALTALGIELPKTEE